MLSCWAVGKRTVLCFTVTGTCLVLLGFFWGRRVLAVNFPMHFPIEVFRNRSGRYRFRVRAGNGGWVPALRGLRRCWRCYTLWKSSQEKRGE